MCIDSELTVQSALWYVFDILHLHRTWKQFTLLEKKKRREVNCSQLIWLAALVSANRDNHYVCTPKREWEEYDEMCAHTHIHHAPNYTHFFFVSLFNLSRNHFHVYSWWSNGEQRTIKWNTTIFLYVQGQGYYPFFFRLLLLLLLLDAKCNCKCLFPAAISFQYLCYASVPFDCLSLLGYNRSISLTHNAYIFTINIFVLLTQNANELLNNFDYLYLL